MSDKPPLSQKDVYRIMAEFMQAGGRYPERDEVLAWCERRSVDEQVVASLAKSIETSAAVSLMMNVMPLMEEDEAPDPRIVSATVEISAAIGITFFMLGFEVARETG